MTGPGKKSAKSERHERGRLLRHSLKGCAVIREGGRECQRRYRQSPKGIECQRRYRQSPKGLEYQRQRDRTPARRQYKREWARQYRQSAIYKERQLEGHYKRADALYRELISAGPNDPRRVEQFHRLQDFLARREAQIRGDWEPAPSTIRARAARERERDRLLVARPEPAPKKTQQGRRKWRVWLADGRIVDETRDI
jgi:hypothetical protein